jgi:transcriptional regulator with XRE-family HTH domain
MGVSKKTDKSLYRVENRIYAELLRDVRMRAGISQMDLVAALKKTQTYASEAERGIRRLDWTQIRDWCVLCNTTLPAFAEEFEARMVDPAFAEPRETDGRKRAVRKR